jgi:glycyl-tRNA synthetase
MSRDACLAVPDLNRGPRLPHPPTASRMESPMALRSDRLDAIVNLSKRRGFVYPSSEIYGGLRAAWDYGPLGVELKNNIKRQWWRSMVQEREDVVGIDSSVILAREVWEASGHVANFVDPLTECEACHKRFRADHLIEAYEEKHGHPPENGLADIACPNCGTRGAFTKPRMFNGLLRTYIGATEDDSGLAYLRPETAQGIFINYKNVLQTSRRKVPFGIGQIGKSFRNEITPGNFIFRTREFEQMEMEFFVRPGTDEEWHQYWIDRRFAWYTDLGIRAENLRRYEHPKDKLSHYSKRTVDIEYRFDFVGSEWGELEGIANRTDYDLSTHQRESKVDMTYLDQESGERFIPYVIEPAAGVDRGALVFLLDAYAEDEAPDAKGKPEKRTVLRLDPRIAPVKVAVLPLSRNADLSPKAKDIAAMLRKRWNTEFDDASAIGRRYRRQDEIGTPYCVTVDFESLDDQAVTVRERDSMAQKRISVDTLESYLADRLPIW